ncbi:MAG TPA: hypothetical protein VF884_14880 [Nitrososphaeraceae archaeon]
MVLKFVTPSAVEFTGGNSLSAASFALYFSFCAYELFMAKIIDAIAAPMTKQVNIPCMPH